MRHFDAKWFDPTTYPGSLPRSGILYSTKNIPIRVQKGSGGGGKEEDDVAFNLGSSGVDSDVDSVDNNGVATPPGAMASPNSGANSSDTTPEKTVPKTFSNASIRLVYNFLQIVIIFNCRKTR